MNLLEHYIIEIHDEKQSEYKEDWIIADVTVDCYGIKERVTHHTTKEEWEKEKMQGYYLA